MSDKNDKTLSETLFAFNNRIVAIKDVIKKAKIFQNTKLVRQIKLLAKKKGNEAQLEKNKRKCEHLKEEIQQINKLKFNEIAIFTFDNDGVSFEQYLKVNNKNLTIDKIALARIALSKQVIKAVDDIKNDPKIQNWKHIFIKYKARCEKRKNWKEKNRLLKEIESKLKPENSENEEEEEQEKDAEVNDSEKKLDLNKKESFPAEQKAEKSEKKMDQNKKESVPVEPQAEKSTKINKKPESVSDDLKASKPEKKAPIERKVKFSDDESEEDDEFELENDEDDDAIDGYDSHEDDKWNEEPQDNSEDSESDEEQSDSQEEEEGEEESVDLSEKFVFKKSNLEKKEDKRTANLKPLVIGEKPSHMVIKQINLDEVKDCEELPIEEEKTEKKENFSNETLSIIQDPFFLDKNGNEIQGDYNNNRPFKRSYDFEDEPMSYSSYDRYRKNRNDFNERRNNYTQSSYRNSLSSNGGQDRQFDRRSNNFDRPRKEFSRDNRNYDGHKREFSRDNNNFKNNRNGFDKRNEKRPFMNNRVDDNKPKEDISKLHPSWQAKKLAEEKAKALKFEGKKIKFDDDE
ncbi:unnamed protein product [Brachionus calyciflorus]|uniref:Serum response factor-binding protein 1 n=1 Tax=Brachionus calyciflorus TaxID=104777 RepID=A0A813Z5H1_9BILA|nr:unnamed protein product [Brachionus calyciflorus]